jgi:hypothetical protein
LEHSHDLATATAALSGIIEIMTENPDLLRHRMPQLVQAAEGVKAVNDSLRAAVRLWAAGLSELELEELWEAERRAGRLTPVIRTEPADAAAGSSPDEPSGAGTRLWASMHPKDCAAAIRESNDLESLSNLLRAETRPGVMRRLNEKIRRLREVRVTKQVPLTAREAGIEVVRVAIEEPSGDGDATRELIDGWNEELREAERRALREVGAGERLCIIGGPCTGKTTLASTMENVLHTDDLIGELQPHRDGLQHDSHELARRWVDWSGVSEHVATTWLTRPGPWVIEGVAVVRALRKWLADNADGKPCDRVVLLTEPRVRLSKDQEMMAKSHAKVWEIVRPLLRSRGVAIEEDFTGMACRQAQR